MEPSQLNRRVPLILLLVLLPLTAGCAAFAWKDIPKATIGPLNNSSRPCVKLTYRAEEAIFVRDLLRDSNLFREVNLDLDGNGCEMSMWITEYHRPIKTSWWWTVLRGLTGVYLQPIPLVLEKTCLHLRAEVTVEGKNINKTYEFEDGMTTWGWIGFFPAAIINQPMRAEERIRRNMYYHLLSLMQRDGMFAP